MPAPLHTGRLVLTPEDPYLNPDDPQRILSLLHDIGFIAERLAGSAQRYHLGEHFLQLVTFMGCSPNIRLEPGEPGEPFCHLVVDGPSEHPRLLQGKNTTPPRCAACRKRLERWPSLFETWRQQPDRQIACPHCGHLQTPATYDFRHSGGCGRLFLMVENIFPQEAIPSPELLAHLQSSTDDQAWRYFYLQDG